MITNRQKNIIIYFIGKALFLGVGYSIILNKTNNDSWICSTIGSILGLIFCFLIKRILNNQNNLNNLFIVRILLVILSSIIITYVFFIIKEFAKSFFLLNTPPFFILLPLVLIAIYISFKSYSFIGNLCECLFPISIFLLLFSFVSLVFKVDYSNIRPILSHSSIDMIKSTFFYFSLSSSPLIFLLDMNLDNNNIYNSYILTSIIISVILVFLVGILTPSLTTIYRFPEYMILKDISIFNFIEKIENILSISWIIDSFILLCITVIFLKGRLPKKYKNYYLIFLLVSLYIVSITFLDNNFVNNIYVYMYLPYILTLIVVPVIIFLALKNKHNKTTQN